MDFLLDKTTHDLVITNKDIPLVTGGEEVAQRLTIKLRSYKGEWFRDVNYGVPWYEILSKSGNKELIDNYIKAIVQEDPDISSIISYNSVVYSTSLQVTFKAKEISGQVVNINLEV